MEPGEVPSGFGHQEVPELFLNLCYSQQALGMFNEAGRSFRIFLELTPLLMPDNFVKNLK